MPQGGESGQPWDTGQHTGEPGQQWQGGAPGQGGVPPQGGRGVPEQHWAGDTTAQQQYGYPAEGRQFGYPSEG